MALHVDDPTLRTGETTPLTGTQPSFDGPPKRTNGTKASSAIIGTILVKRHAKPGRNVCDSGLALALALVLNDWIGMPGLYLALSFRRSRPAEQIERAFDDAANDPNVQAMFVALPDLERDSFATPSPCGGASRCPVTREFATCCFLGSFHPKKQSESPIDEVRSISQDGCH